jgi:hypothetical protein
VICFPTVPVESIPTCLCRMDAPKCETKVRNSSLRGCAHQVRAVTTAVLDDTCGNLIQISQRNT